MSLRYHPGDVAWVIAEAITHEMVREMASVGLWLDSILKTPVWVLWWWCQRGLDGEDVDGVDPLRELARKNRERAARGELPYVPSWLDRGVAR